MAAVCWNRVVLLNEYVVLKGGGTRYVWQSATE